MASVQYVEREAKLYLQYARAAFCSEEHIKRWDCGPICKAAPTRRGGVRFLGPGKQWQVQGFVAALPQAGDHDSQRCVFAFRGSSSVANWVANAKVLLTEWPRWPVEWCGDCMVHTGFADAYGELRQQFLDALKTLRCRQVSVAGHSLGGGVATLATLDVRSTLNLKVEPVYLFGSPRVGDIAFVKAFTAAAMAQGVEPDAWRVVHYHDPVPRLNLPTGEYKHVGREVYYYTRDESAYRVCEVCEDGTDDPKGSAEMSGPNGELVNLDHVTYLNLTLRKGAAPEFGEPTCFGPMDTDEQLKRTSGGGLVVFLLLVTCGLAWCCQRCCRRCFAGCCCCRRRGFRASSDVLLEASRSAVGSVAFAEEITLPGVQMTSSWAAAPDVSVPA